MTHYLTKGQWLRAVYLWHGGCDTFEIAEAFDVPETLIYSKLPKWREQFPNIREAA
jgi:hypothetical protein